LPRSSSTPTGSPPARRRSTKIVDGLVDDSEGFLSSGAGAGDDEEDEGEETTDLGASA